MSGLDQWLFMLAGAGCQKMDVPNRKQQLCDFILFSSATECEVVATWRFAGSATWMADIPSSTG